MKILILGGTGAMGLHLVQSLNEKGYEIYVTSRKKRNSSSTNIHYIKGNAHETEFLKSILKQNWDAIIDFMVYTTTEFKKHVFLLLNATTQYVFISSSRVYACSEKPLIEDSPRLLDSSEDQEFLASDEYALSKARQEDILKNSSRQNWTIIRPYITYSEKRLQLGVLEKETWIYRALHHRTIVFSKDIAEKVTTLTYGLDVANGIASIVGEKSAKCQIYHITSNESHTWMEVFNWYLMTLEKHVGYKPKVMFIEKNPRIAIKGSNYQVIYDRYCNRKFDNTKIKVFKDISEFKGTKEGITTCLEAFIKYPHFNIINWSEHAMYDRIAGEWTSLSEINSWKHRIIYLLRRTILPK